MRIRITADQIVRWVNRHFESKQRKNGKELLICSPFDNDNKFKFNISLTKAVCHCWYGDDWAGPISPKTGKRNCSFINFVCRYTKCSYRDAIKQIVGDAVIYEQQSGPTIVYDDNIQLPAGVTLFDQDDEFTRINKRWLLARGYTEESIATAQLHQLGFDVYWPFYEFGELVYWQARCSLDKRFRFPDQVVSQTDQQVVRRETGKSDYFYGFDHVNPSSYLIIVESIFNQIVAGDQVLASGGAVLGNGQLGKLKLLNPINGIILAPDCDAAGVLSLLNNYKLLKPLGFKLFYSLPPRRTIVTKSETVTTNDWNDLFRYDKHTPQQIRQVLDSQIRVLNPAAVVQLQRLQMALTKE